MKLLIHELSPSVFQEITIDSNKNILVSSIRPHLYRHNFPVGSLVIEIHDVNGELITSSEEINIDDIEAGNGFYHGYIRFNINVFLRKGTTYRIVIKATNGYSYNKNSFVGVCNSFDLQTYNQSYDSENSSLGSPLDIQVWESI